MAELSDFVLQDFDVSKIPDLETFNALTQTTGSWEKALSYNLYGINHEAVKGIVPENRDSYGLVFFTRPMLNLSSPNLRRDRKFYPLLTMDFNSIQTYVRCMLDPRLSRDYKPDEATSKFYASADYKEYEATLQPSTSASDLAKANLQEKFDAVKLVNIRSPLVDENLGFIPILTNTIKEMSGWPDNVMPTFTSKEGLKKEQWMMADGFTEYYSSFELDCTFRNIKDEPLILMFETWLRYMSRVHEGVMAPYLDFEWECEMDYNTRIYRLILDESKTFVKKISACGAAIPVNVPNGKFFDFTDSEKYNTSNKEVNIRFQCVGAEYNDVILVHEFNQVCGIFNVEYRNMLHSLEHNLVEIPFNMLHLFNYRGYPFIDYYTQQLRWFISKDSYIYKKVIDYLENSDSKADGFATKITR